MKADLLIDDDPLDRGPDQTAERLRFWRRSLAKHMWSALGLLFLVMLTTTLVVYSLTPIYRSTATLFIESGKSKVVSIEEVYSQIGSTREYFQTQSEILKSRQLAERLVRKLNLTRHPVMDPRLKQPSRLDLSWLSLSSSEKPAPTEEEIFDSVTDNVMAHLDVQPVRLSQLVKISFNSPDRELAARVPNALAEIYIENDLEARLQMTQQASTWLSERLGGLRQKLAASERALQDYRERERIVDVKGMAVSGVGKQLEQLMTSLVDARRRRAEAENAYQQVQSATAGKASVDSIPAVLKDPLIQKLREVQADAERKLAEAKKRYGTENPRLAVAESELKTAQANTRAQVDLVIAGITKEFEVARANEQSLEAAMNQGKSEVQSINRKEFQLGVLEREVAANRQLYDMFLNRSRETNIGGDLQSTIARIVDPAKVTNTPVSPRKELALAMALILGLMLGAILAFLLEFLDNTVKNSEDVETKLGLPLLGVLQRITGKQRSTALQRAVVSDPKSIFAEAVRTIRTSIMMSGIDHPRKIILVTSSVPDEGKTTVAMNIAVAFGQIRKTCLIDADMRRPSVGRVLDISGSTPGLSNLIAGTEPPEKCIHHDAETGIHVIPGGASHPNPQELLSSRRFNEVMKKLHEMFDVIIIDTPPVQLMSDSLILSSHVNSVVYVVKADQTPVQVASAGIQRLRKAGAPIMGVVLNQQDLKKADRYYGYGKYSAYGRYSDYRKGYSDYGFTNAS